MSAQAATRKLYTPEEFLELDDAGYELRDGQLEERNVSVLSSEVEMNVALTVGAYVKAAGLGFIAGPSLGLQIFPDPDRIPRADFVFVAAARRTPEMSTAGFLRIPPDLVVEVVSPGDTFLKVDGKVEEYLHAGVRLVWVINPYARKVLIHRADGSDATTIRDGETISGEDVIPGFECPVARFFPAVPDVVPGPQP